MSAGPMIRSTSWHWMAPVRPPFMEISPMPSMPSEVADAHDAEVRTRAAEPPPPAEIMGLVRGTRTGIASTDVMVRPIPGMAPSSCRG